VITVRHAESPDVGRVRRRLEGNPELLSLGPEAVLYAILDQLVDEYAPVVAGLENDIDEIEDQLFDGDPAVSRRIYELSREVIEFQRATHPLPDMLAALERGFDKYDVDIELRRNLRDVADHVQRVVERGDAFRELLHTALTVNATLVGQRQNEEMRSLTEASLAQNEEVKRISAWAAILFAPTLIGTIYGMNFDTMPELHWTLGYPMAVFLMVAMGVVLYRAASCSVRPVVRLPSVISTIRAGTGPVVPSTLARVLANRSMVCTQDTMASPVAVRSSRVNPAMACLAAARLVVGDTSTGAMPAKDTIPRLIPGVRSSTNRVAAFWAAANRLGATSVACMDSDTSMASMTVARFRGSFASAVGPASATASRVSPRRISAVGRCRDRRGRWGAILSSRCGSTNRRVCRLVRRWASR